MPAASHDEVTAILQQAGESGGPGALDVLIPAVYEELRSIAVHRLRGRGDVTLSPTFAAAARAMRNIIEVWTRVSYMSFQP
jgi:hypothetical protein